MDLYTKKFKIFENITQIFYNESQKFFCHTQNLLLQINSMEKLNIKISMKIKNFAIHCMNLCTKNNIFKKIS